MVFCRVEKKQIGTEQQNSYPTHFQEKQGKKKNSLFPTLLPTIGQEGLDSCSPQIRDIIELLEFFVKGELLC